MPLFLGRRQSAKRVKFFRVDFLRWLFADDRKRSIGRYAGFQNVASIRFRSSSVVVFSASPSLCAWLATVNAIALLISRIWLTGASSGASRSCDAGEQAARASQAAINI